MSTVTARDASLRAMARALPEAVALLGEDRNVLEANDAFCRLVGFSREALINRRVPLLDGFPSASGSGEQDVPEMESWLSPVVIVAGDGTQNDVLASFSRLEREGDQEAAYVMSVRLEWVPLPRLLRDPKPARVPGPPGRRGSSSRAPARAPRRRRISSELELAAQRGELFPRYQPIVSLADGQIEAFEALLRWDHPVHGVLGPASFIGEAESRGILADITCEILHEVCADASHWNRLRDARSGQVSVCVNLCGSQLRHPDLLASIDDALTASGLPATALWLEITENTGITEATRDPGLLSAVRSRGVRVVLDDFGSGYASLGSVRRLPLDAVKLDRSLIAGVADNRCDARILAAGIEIAEALEIDVIAEGIEHGRQLAYLQTLQCRYGQGFYYSRPLDRSRAELLVCDPPSWTQRSGDASSGGAEPPPEAA